MTAAQHHAPDALPASLTPSLRAILTDHAATRAPAGESGAHVVRLEAPGRPACWLKSAEGALAHAVTDEFARLAWLNGRDLAPAVLHFERTPDAAHLLTRAVPGTNAHALLSARPRDRTTIAERIGRWLAQLHALPVDDCPFDASPALRLAAAQRNVVADLVDESDFDDERAGWTATEVYAATCALLPLPFTRVVTHGDFSLDNVLVGDDRVHGCIDWGRAGVSDPYQDLAIMWRDLGEFGAAVQRAFLAAYGLDRPDEGRLRFFQLLDEFF